MNQTITEENDGYSRNYNIGPRSFLTCIMHSSQDVHYKETKIDATLEKRNDRFVAKTKDFQQEFEK